MPRLNLDRVQFIADVGVNWRTRDEATALVLAARAAGFHFVSFHVFDLEYLREVRSEEMKAVYRGLLPQVNGLAPYLADLCLRERIGLALTALTEGAVETAMLYGRAMRVPLERANDQRYMMAWAKAKGSAIGMYETTATWPSANVGRMPLFVAPGYPAKEEFYDPYWKSGNLRGRLGVSFHAPSKDLFVRAAVVGAPMISLPVRPLTYSEAPDRAISVPMDEAAEWMGDVREAGATK